jgi:hypothetical protein
MNPFNVLVIGLCVVLCVIALSATEEPNPNDMYCDMVQVYKDTGGVYGWPAYKGEEVCK